ncbi:ABC transporter permease [Streptomonospora litoralis]|uniref:Transport permease protein n=1 Tax=Streptomonospora litoralis TaxID=2498135 RepID=A0A4P6PZ82_9ACTN|nr:ABC transporter permease [Streptomonospora litoralis]QBI53568.1 Teichoic acid translocation permease protein TagG [Streptomonospora litoralis]
MALDGVTRDRPEPDAAEMASRYGLSVSGARPGLPEYLRRLWEHRYFIGEFAKARSSTKYTRARLGAFWFVLTPLLNAAVYYLIFGLLLGTSRGVEDFISFLVIGVFIFTFTRNTVTSGVKAVYGERGLIRALHFPRAVLPITQVTIQLRQMVISMVVLMVIVAARGNLPDWEWLLMVPVLALQLMFNTGLALWAARLGSKASDAAQWLPFVLRAWMYGSGVLYSVERFTQGAPEWVGVLLNVQPAAVYIDFMRYALMSTDNFGAENLPPYAWLIALGWALLALIAGFVYFYRAEEEYGRD